MTGMSKREVAAVLTTASVIDGVTVTPEMINLWHLIVGQFEFEDVHAALIAHLSESTYPVKPADIVNQLKKSVAKRRELYGIHPKAPEGQQWAVDVMDSMKELSK